VCHCLNQNLDTGDPTGELVNQIAAPGEKAWTRRAQLSEEILLAAEQM
jgi:hypothetical protein